MSLTPNFLPGNPLQAPSGAGTRKLFVNVGGSNFLGSKTELRRTLRERPNEIDVVWGAGYGHHTDWWAVPIDLLPDAVYTVDGGEGWTAQIEVRQGRFLFRP